MRTRILALAMAAALAGCASEPFAYLEGRRYDRADMHSYDATVISVDGRDYLQRPVRIEPGRRSIVLQAPPVAGSRYGTQRTLEIDIAPCQRYYFAAIRKSVLDQDWEPRVDYVDTIAGCNAAKQ